MLLFWDVIGGVLLTAVALYRNRVYPGSRELGAVVRTVLASFGLATLLVDGLLPGFWLIVNYGLYGGRLEDHLLPGSEVGTLLRALAAGLLISTYAAVRAYLDLITF